jgi:hypothetical protein
VTKSSDYNFVVASTLYTLRCKLMATFGYVNPPVSPDELEAARQRQAVLQLDALLTETEAATSTMMLPPPPPSHLHDEVQCPPSAADVKDFIFGRGKWENTEAAKERHLPWKRLFGFLINDYVNETSWFMLVELAMCVSVGILGGVVPDSDAECETVALLSAIVYSLYAFTLCYFRPFWVPFHTWTFLPCAVVQAVGVIAISIYLYVETQEWLLDVGSYLPVFATYVLMAKQFIDLLLQLLEGLMRIYEHVTKRPLSFAHFLDTRYLREDDDMRSNGEDDDVLPRSSVGAAPAPAVPLLSLPESAQMGLYDDQEALQWLAKNAPVGPAIFDGDFVGPEPDEVQPAMRYNAATGVWMVRKPRGATSFTSQTSGRALDPFAGYQATPFVPAIAAYAESSSDGLTSSPMAADLQASTPPSAVMPVTVPDSVHDEREQLRKSLLERLGSRSLRDFETELFANAAPLPPLLDAALWPPPRRAEAAHPQFETVFITTDELDLL